MIKIIFFIDFNNICIYINDIFIDFNRFYVDIDNIYVDFNKLYIDNLITCINNNIFNLLFIINFYIVEYKKRSII